TDDARPEQNETVEIMLLHPKGDGAIVGLRGTTTLVIHDNDFIPETTNPVDDSRFFVRQHYHDFLNRVPDAAGLQFWTNNIESCGADAACREVKRIDTSAAFFLSIEFQQTGFLVERAYRAAYNRRAHIGEFLADTQEVGRGVVVEDPDFAASEFRPAFVLMQYFGYLRRDPDDAGFQFWLTKLNQFGGDFRRAEMVKAFINSIEYRQRFGQQ